MTPWTVWIGFDPRETAAYAVARYSLQRRSNLPFQVRGVVLETLMAAGVYQRPTSRRGGQLWDDISDAPMSTEFALSRFLVPQLATVAAGGGWALFMDCDVLLRADVMGLFALADPEKAVMCVHHDHKPASATKMDGQVQTAYPRKNWSSVMLLNCDHPANRRLTLDMINTRPGRELHGFCWLDDNEIGRLPPEWNWLVGHSSGGIDPALVHFTDGFPMMPGYENQPYADEWRSQLAQWASVAA